MLTQAPLPTWFSLLRALSRPPVSDAELAAPWRRQGDVAGWLSRSAWSLALIGQWRANRDPDRPVTVWLPDFFCNASLRALRATGVRLAFYPVDDALEPVVKAWKPMAAGHAPDILVLVHYFGRPAAPGSLSAARDLCGKHGAWLVEDAAHVLRPRGAIGMAGDFVLYSPHKLLAVPDGAVLLVRGDGPGAFDASMIATLGAPGEWASQLAPIAEQLGDTEGTLRASLVWLAKRLLQTVGVRAPNVQVPRFEEDECSSIGLLAPRMSGLARRLLAVDTARLWDIARRRHRREALWDGLLTRRHAAAASPAMRGSLGGWTPYLATYSVHGERARGTFEEWRRAGLPATTWPDLPPEVAADRERHATAWRLRHERVYLPVHASLSQREIVGRLVRLTPRDREEHLATLEWDGVSREQWAAWLVQAGRSNLLQSWTYGTAKASTSSFAVRRGVLRVDGRPVAIVQALEKRIAGLATVTRINRGPLFLDQPDDALRTAVWRKLGELGALSARRVLSVVPELSLDGAALVMLASLGFRQFAPRPVESAVVDLGLDREALTRAMRGSWRKAIRHFDSPAGLGISLETSTDEETFEWMMARYAELMRANVFAGAPVAVIRALRAEPGAAESMIVLRASYEGAVVAGILLLVHGATATYLVGWNGETGRRIGANAFLFWLARTELVRRGVRWFDLGGISEEHTPGITQFKLDMGGERYELVGEYWKW